MPAVPDWSQPMTLTSPYGTLALNQAIPGSGIFLLDGEGCKFNIGVRSTKDNVPQMDGAILHYRFLTGTEMALKIQLWDSVEENRVACDALLEEMLDTLTLHLRGLLNAGDNEGRLSWALPSGGPIRMLDDIRCLVYPDFTQDPSSMGSTVLVTVDSQYPYALDLTQNSSGGGTLNNTGTATFWPVIQVASTAAFTITNSTTGVQFEWAGAAFGGYAELDCFRNTIFENGDGANLSYGIVQTDSDYPFLIPGNNDLSISGSSMTVLWQAAWG